MKRGGVGWHGGTVSGRLISIADPEAPKGKALAMKWRHVLLAALPNRKTPRQQLTQRSVCTYQQGRSICPAVFQSFLKPLQPCP